MNIIFIGKKGMWNGVGCSQWGAQNDQVSRNLHNTLLEQEGESVEKVIAVEVKLITKDNVNE